MDKSIKYIKKILLNKLDDILIPILAILISGSVLVEHLFKNGDVTQIFKSSTGAVIAALVGALSSYFFHARTSLKKNRGTILITYSKYDDTVADYFTKRLERIGYSVIEMVNNSDDESDKRSHLKNVLSKTDILVVILNKSFNESNLPFEIQYALRHNVEVIPVISNNKAVLSDELLVAHQVNMDSTDDNQALMIAYQKLLNSITSKKAVA